MEPILKKLVDILCGTLDNQAQIDAEIAQGKQIHPYAKHITDSCDAKIINRPPDHEGIYILEESYYVYPGKDEVELKPLFFYFRSDGASKVFLESVQIPSKFTKEEFTNDNAALIIDWNNLEIRAFGVAEYLWYEEERCFKVDHEADIGNGVTFRLIETLNYEGLQVMELIHKDGVKITPYDTPILYKKVKS
jgi:hypothetical protein